MINWIKNNRTALIRNSFLLPILLVVIMSISHVVSWYDLGNPISWAIYLSVAIEIFALASISAAGIKASKTAIWILFGIVTAIQIIGNIFYEFKDIDPVGEGFVAWMELIQPLFEDWNVLDHRRFLAMIQGGTLPIMSLTALHFYIQFKEKSEETEDDIIEKGKKAEINRVMKKAAEMSQARKDSMSEEEYQEMIDAEPTALANSQYREDDNQRSVFEITKELVNKEEQRKALSEMMKNDEELGLYEEEKFVSDITKKLADKEEKKEVKPNKMVESGTGLPNSSVRKDKGNNATIASRKEVNPKTGQIDKNN